MLRIMVRAGVMRLFLSPVLLFVLFSVACQAQETPAIRALIVDGQSSIHHQDWAARTALLKRMLESAGLFTVDVGTSPAIGEDNSQFQPPFADYNVVIVNYEGDYWSAAAQKAFEDYVSNGGGFVSVHAADNAFPDWQAYNQMIGVGGWGSRAPENGSSLRNRDQSDGPYLRLRDGQWIRDAETPGRAGAHGARHHFKMEVQAPDHPVMAGMPSAWLSAEDELYDRLRGPAENVTVLAAAYSDPATRGTGEYEPLLMAISYGQGRVFHVTLGHNSAALEDITFIVPFQRGVEWVATGQVTQQVPADFPAAP